MAENENLNEEQQEEQHEEQHEEKTFTQAEVDAMIGKRLAKATRGMPSQEELTEFRNWKKEHQTDSDALATVTTERDSAQNELEIAKREILLLKNGIPADDVDFYVYKISKLVNDETTFEDAAKAFLKENKRKTVFMDTGARITGSLGEKPLSIRNALHDAYENKS